MADAPRRVLFFGAHPDDAEISAGGTLALLRRAGWEVAIATVTAGEGGSTALSREEISRVRLQESACAAQRLGGPYYCAGGQDMDVEFSHELRRQVVRILRQARPDAVITLPPQDYHPDHEQTSLLVRAACMYARIPNFHTPQQEPIEHIPHLYYTYAGQDIFGRPAPVGFYVDISDAMEDKVELVACHASQREWLHDHHGQDDYLRGVRERGAELGQRIGTAAAEGFIQHLRQPYPHTNLLAEALATRVHPA